MEGDRILPDIPEEFTQLIKFWPEDVLVFEDNAADLQVLNMTYKRIAFQFDAEHPEYFSISNGKELLGPKAYTTIRILMYPNVANTDISVHRFRMLSMVVSGHSNLRNFEKVWVLAKPENIMVDQWTCRYHQPTDPDEYNFYVNQARNRAAAAEQADAEPTITEEPQPILSPEEIEMQAHIAKLEAENQTLRIQAEQLILCKLEKKLLEGKLQQRRKTLMEKVQVNLRDGLLLAGIDADMPYIKNVILNNNVVITCFCTAIFSLGVLVGNFFF